MLKDDYFLICIINAGKVPPDPAFVAQVEGQNGMLDAVDDSYLVLCGKGGKEHEHLHECELFEPDVIVAIYPDMAFPFLGDKYERQSDETRRKSEERAILKAEKGVLPNDIITLICFVDSYAFKDSGAYSGNGISLHLIVKRHELEKFYEELKAEYIEFKKRFKVDEHNFKELENDWEPMEL